MENQIDLRFTKTEINTKDETKHTQNNSLGYFLPLYTWMHKDFHKKEKKKKRKQINTLKGVDNRIF